MADPTWNDPIKGYLSDSSEHMSQITGGALDLSDYHSVLNDIGPIQAQIDAGTMPPGGGLDPKQIAIFDQWVALGCPEK